jgi:hypothetical protein
VNPSSAGDPVSLLCAEPNIELKDMATAGGDPAKVAVALARGIAGPTATVRLEIVERVVGYVDASASLDTVGNGLGATGTEGVGARGRKTEAGETGACASWIRGAGVHGSGTTAGPMGISPTSCGTGT